MGFKSISLPTFLLLAISWLSSCAGNGAYETMLKTLLSRNVPEIRVDSLFPIYEEVILLDSREEREYQVSHLKNAIHVGYDHFNISSVDTLPKNAKIVVYCSVGYRSEKITQQLIKNGFTNVSNLFGGIFDWVNSDYPIYLNGSTTQKIHGYNKTWGRWLKKGEKVFGE